MWSVDDGRFTSAPFSGSRSNKKPINWWGRHNAAPLEFIIFGNFSKLWDVSTGSTWWHYIRFGCRLCRLGCPHTVWCISVAELFDSLAAAPVLHTFVQYLIASCSRLEAASDVMSGRFLGLTVPQNDVKFRDSRLNRSEEIWPKDVGCSIFGRFSNFDKCRPEVAGDGKSGVALGYVGTDVCANVGDFRLNSGQIIRLFGRTRFTHFCAVFSCILRPTGGVIYSAVWM